MAKIRNKKTGKVIEVNDKDLHQYGLGGKKLPKALFGIKQHGDLESMYNQGNYDNMQLLPERTDFGQIGNFNKIGGSGMDNPQINLGNTQPNFNTGQYPNTQLPTGYQPNYTYPAQDFGEDIDNTQFQNNDVMYNPNQTYNPNIITDSPIVQTPEFNPGLTQSVVDYNKQMGRGKTNVYGTPEELSQITPGKTNTNINWKNAFPGITGIGGNTFLSKGISQLGSGLTNIGKGSLDMIGNMKMNNRQQINDARKFQQSVHSDSEQITPYDIYGKDVRGGNAFFANGGMSIKEIGGQGQANVEVEGGGGNSEGEHILLPNGFSEAIRGETHANDGVKLNLPANSMIFSEKLKDPITGKSYSKLAKPFETKKDVNRQIDKRADDLQKKTADLNIKFKENKLKALFEVQENNKLMGEHGKKVQMEAIEQLNPMAENGKLIKAEDGFYNGNLTQIPLQNKSYSPGDARDIIKTFLESPDYKYKNTPEDLKKGKERLKQQLKLNNSLTPELEISINKAPSFQALNPVAGQLQAGTWNLHPEAAQHYGLNIAPTRKGLQYLVDNNLINPKDYPSFIKNGKVSIGSMKDFPDTAEAQKLKSVIEKLPQDKKSSYAETNYKDNEWYYRNPEFKEFKFKNKAEYDKYIQDNTSNKYGDYYYSGVEGLYQKPIYPTDTPQLQPINQNPKIEYRDRIKTIKGDTNIDLPPVNIGMVLPNVYGRDPLNYYKIQPEFIDPRYLNVQPQLNDITRGVRTVQNNLGDRSTSAIGNSLQAQINAYEQENQVYGNKYNYDKGQDSQAQQFNAQAKMNTDQYNQGTWFSELENPIRQREGIIDTQYRTDRVGALNNWNEMNAYNNDKDYILNTFNPGTSGVDFGGVKNTTNVEAKLKEKAKQEVLYKKYLAEAEDNLLTKKNGGKIKTKLKLKK